MRRTSPQTRTCRLQAMFAAVLLGASASAGAQQMDGFEGFDASVLLGSASDVLARTPD